MRRQDATGSKREGEESPPKEKVKILLSKQVPSTLTVLEPFKFENRTADTATMARMFRLERRETRRNSNFEEGEGGWMLAAGVQLCNLQGVLKSGLGGPSLTVHSVAYNPPPPRMGKGGREDGDQTQTLPPLVCLAALLLPFLFAFITSCSADPLERGKFTYFLAYISIKSDNKEN